MRILSVSIGASSVAEILSVRISSPSPFLWFFVSLRPFFLNTGLAERVEISRKETEKGRKEGRIRPAGNCAMKHALQTGYVRFSMRRLNVKASASRKARR
jgi:hypothetical protein